MKLSEIPKLGHRIKVFEKKNLEIRIFACSKSTVKIFVNVSVHGGENFCARF